MKKIIAILISSLITLSLVACNNDKGDSLSKENEASTDMTSSLNDNTVSSSNSEDNEETFDESQVENSSADTEKELTSDDVTKLLENYFGEKDEQTGYLNVIGVNSEKEEINGKLFFTGRLSRLVQDHTSLVSELLVTEDGSKLYLAEFIDSQWYYNENDPIYLK